jgi:hypothetical protein
MTMGRVYLALTFAVVCLFHSMSRADDTAPAPPAASSSGLTLTPGPDIILMPGEHVPLTITDSSTNKPVQVSKISWTIDGQSIEQPGHPAGSLDVPDDNPFATSTIYTAPAQVPAKPMELKASVATADPPVILTAKIRIINEPNWFAIEGDVPHGTPTSVSIVADSRLPSDAGPYNGPFRLMQGQYLVTVFGTDKVNPSSRAKISLTLGRIASGTTGTFPWIASRDSVGAEIFCANQGLIDWVVGDYAKPATLGGSTTLLEPVANDNSGLVRGFFAGNLVWLEMIQSHRPIDFKKHYAFVQGHFAVPKSK